MQKITELEKTYQGKLKLEEPAKYWDNRAKELRKQGWWSLGIGVVLVVGIGIFFRHSPIKNARHYLCELVWRR